MLLSFYSSSPVFQVRICRFIFSCTLPLGAHSQDAVSHKHHMAVITEWQILTVFLTVEYMVLPNWAVWADNGFLLKNEPSWVLKKNMAESSTLNLGIYYVIHKLNQDLVTQLSVPVGRLSKENDGLGTATSFSQSQVNKSKRWSYNETSGFNFL